MVDTPNSTTSGGILRSWGDGSNNAYWLPFTPYTSAVSGTGIVTTGTTPVAMTTPLSVTVSGYYQYLAFFNFSGQNTDTGSAHDFRTQLALDGATLGNYMQHTCPSASGGLQTVSITNSFIISTDDNLQHTISGFACINSTANGNVIRSNLVVLGIS